MDHRLQEGSVSVIYKDGMYRTFVNGRNYISEDKENLLQSISHYHPVITPDKPVPVDKRSASEKLVDILTSPSSGLAIKQIAIEKIFAYEGEKDKHADKILKSFKKKPKVSREAASITRALKKSDFCLVTHEELVENVYNIVLRSRLMDELADRLKF